MITKQYKRVLAVVLSLLTILLPSVSFAGAVQARPLSQSPVDAESIRGQGDFPRTALALEEPETRNMMLYLVEGDTATPLLDLSKITDEEIELPDNITDIRLSPDQNRVAYRLYTDYGSTFLGTIDLESNTSALIDTGFSGGKGEASEVILAFAWLNDQELVYHKQLNPANAESPLDETGQLWLGDMKGTTQLLVAGDVSGVLGGSPDSSQVYYLRRLPGLENIFKQGVGVYDRTTGDLTHLWPNNDEVASLDRVYHNFTLISLPSGEQRVLYTASSHAEGPSSFPPVIWSGNPVTGETKPIWEVKHSVTSPSGHAYFLPHNYLWSPDSEDAFIYMIPGRNKGAYTVDLKSGELKQMFTESLQLLSWQDDKIIAYNTDWRTKHELIMLTLDGEQVGSISISYTPAINQTPTPTITEDTLFCVRQLSNNPGLGATSGLWFNRYCAACYQSQAETSTACKVVPPLCPSIRLWIAWKLCSQLYSDK